MTSTLRSLTKLLREPGFTAITVLTLGLGLGAVITIFSLVDGVLLEQLPYPEPDGLLTINHKAPTLGLETMGISPKLYMYYRDNARVFDEVALMNDTQVTITGEGEPERIRAANVTPSFFRALQMPAALGRTFSEEEGALGAPDVAVLSDGLWRERFGASASVLGQKIQVKGVPHEVVGVMPPELDLPHDETRIWLVRQVDEANAQLGNFGDFAVVRLARGESIESARANLATYTDNLAEIFPEDQDGASGILQRAGFMADVQSLLEFKVGNVRSVMWILLGTVGVILLIACANVTNLFLVRVEERVNEVAVRSALGASRAHLVRGMMAETMVVCLLAGALGLGLASLAVAAIKNLGPGDIPRLGSVGIDSRVLLFGLSISLIAGVVLGLLPAIRGSRSDLVGALKEGGRSSTTGLGRHRLRSGLVMAQVALGLVLLVGCGLLLRSLFELRSVDPGFRTEGALTFHLTLPRVKYPEGEDRARFADLVMERLSGLPGVEGVGGAAYLPLTSSSSGSGYNVEEFPLQEGDLPQVFMTNHVTAGYMESMGMRLLEGRFLERRDIEQRTGAVVVSKALADKVWPEGSALGKRIQPGELDEEKWSEIVGVIDHVYNDGLDQEAPPTVFRGFLGPPEDGQDVDVAMAFVVRTEGDPASLSTAVRSEVWGLDPDVPISQLQTIDRLVEASRARMNFTVVVLMVASLMALLIAAVGLYGVVSYLVSLRRHEIGVRMALGADRRLVSQLVLRDGLVVSIGGMMLGLVLAFFATRWLESILFGVGRFDPPTFVLVPLVLLGVTLFASWVPASRASRTDPLIALRHD